MAMDIVKSIVHCAAGPIWSQIEYIISYNTNVDKLNAQFQSLKEAKDSLQQLVTAAERNGEDIFDNVQNSLTQANDSIDVADNFLNGEDHARVGCLNCSFQNLWTMHQLSKKSTEMSKEISEIITQVNEAMKMPTISSLPRLEVSLSPSTRGYEALQSRTSILNDIMQELKDDNIYMIGVYGMGGVGKSTLVEEVAWQAEHGGSYGVVIKATVTRSPDVERIQGQLADGLGLKFNKESSQGRAQQLRDKITKENKVLVIMDDLWEKIDLKEVGVPFGDQHKGCKLLLTSRNLNVLKKDMGTQKNFGLETLSKKEGWNLFKKAAGDVLKDNEIQTIACEVARACKGLPLLLVTVAKALKDERRLYAWKDAFTELDKYDDEGYPALANEAVELSYNYLASDQHKSIFLQIGSYRKDYHIEDLFMSVWGLGLFKKVDKLGDARNKIHKLLDDLKASSLILDVERQYVRMHDVNREGAAKIASRDQPFFSMQHGTKLNEWPEMDELSNCKEILLPWCYIPSLPECLDCPKLELLVLCSKDYNLKIPDHFFSRMTNLKFLYLGGMMCTPSLPPSLSFLEKLKALSLYKCMLEDITIVSELKGLEILCLEDTDIQELPEELGKLTRLRMLDLDNFRELKVIPANLISSLTRLEELYMENCHIQWEVEGRKQGKNNASLGELRKLNHLKSLHLQIHDISNMPRDLLIFGELEKYKILIGDGWEWSWHYAGYSEISRTLKLNLSSTTIAYLDLGIKMLLSGVEDLSLAEVKGARNVLPEFNGEGFAQLKHLLIQNCAEILYIIDSTEWVLPFHSFLCLESLVIRNLINLEKICCGQLTIDIFSKLQFIKVEGCESLKNIFSFSMARNLPNLLHIKISKCKVMTNVIVEEGEEEFDDNAQISFSKLLSISLESLPKLFSFCSKKSTTDIQSGSDITEYSDNLSYPIALFDEKIAMPNLETMWLCRINMVKLCDISAPSCFQNLTRLTVECCDNLKYLFSSLMGKTLVKLQDIEITCCPKMEQIIVQDEEYLCKEKSEMQPILQNIKNVEVVGCPMLKNILPSSSSEPFQNLNMLWVGNCSGIVNIMTSSAARSLLNLTTLIVYECEMVEEIVACEDDSDGGEIVFMKLERLQLEDLPRLTRFCKENFSFTFPSLKTLHVRGCPKMEAFSHSILSTPKLREEVYFALGMQLLNIDRKKSRKAFLNGP